MFEIGFGVFISIISPYLFLIILKKVFPPNASSRLIFDIGLVKIISFVDCSKFIFSSIVILL